MPEDLGKTNLAALSFNPRPAVRPGDAIKSKGRGGIRRVSIRARP